MTERPVIPRTPDLPVALDWSALRAEGLARIQALSGKVWTDHNSHDPGITTLEILAYALTDLAYRSSFPVADLLTRPDGRIDDPALSGLQPAHEVLTTAPRTVADYRRLLMRLDGVRNAWAIPLDPGPAEVAIFADCLDDALSFNPANSANLPNHPVPLTGLWNVRVDLETDDRLGVMNQTALVHRVLSGPLKGVVLRLDCLAAPFQEGRVDPTPDLVSHVVSQVTAMPLGFTARLALSLNSGPPLDLHPWLIRVILDRPRFDRPPVTIDLAMIEAVLAGTTPDDIVPRYWEKQQRRAQALARVTAALHAHRGLCEDFLSIGTIDSFAVGICADVELHPDADLEAVQAAVFHAIEHYLAPPVRYRTLDEMLDMGVPVDRIFNGPHIDFTLRHAGAPLFTKPGFVTDAELAATELRRAVHTSDIVNLIMEIPGVAAIRNVLLRGYDRNGVADDTSQPWSLSVPPEQQPGLNIEASKILFHRSGIPFRAQPTEFERTLADLHAADRREVYVPPDQVLPQPVGRWRSLDAFHSVQHDFPETYRIGAAGIARSEGVPRIAQAQQFKGYLTFFDQILADYLGQLGGLRQLYGLDPALTRSWFSPALSGMAGSTGDFETEFLTDPAAYADSLTRARLTETEEQFQDRRNRVLDHLIARFAERFADYALMQFRLSGDRLKTGAELIADKIGFLRAYPKLSRERGHGANIRPEAGQPVWNTDNISGLERRAGRLTGIDQPRRTNLHCASHFAALFSVEPEAATFRIVIIGPANIQLFASDEVFPDAAAAMTAAQAAYDVLRAAGGIIIGARQGTAQFELTILSDAQSLTHRPAFDTQAEATLAARAIIDRYDSLLHAGPCNSEGMHLIEHILLRPRAPDHALMPVCLPQDCDFCGEQDPYSFRVSVVLPYWPERFRDLNFRTHAERTLREEAPAHVQVRVCWVGQQQMAALDRAHRIWLQALRTGRAATIRQPAADLIAVLDRLTTVYPAATLHDCDLGEAETPVRLGATALGLF